MSAPGTPASRWARLAPWIIPAAAVLMGLPTLRGRFVGGDDHRLVLDHVLVSRPSWSHAAQLLGMVHRDLYQPLPLLSFSAEFAVIRGLGLRADVNGPGGGAWLFHLTNVLLHALNAWLVWLLMRRLHSSRRVAAAAGLLFAIHPLQVEVVAWVNGRMMLMSTLFVLLALLATLRFLRCPPPERPHDVTHRRRQGGAAPTAPTAMNLALLPRMTSRSWLAGLLVLLCVAAAMMSKVRVSLPILMLITVIAAGHVAGLRPPLWRRRRFVVLWALCAAVTAGFTWLNVTATAESDMFLQGAEKLQGPRLARAMIALAWYLSHVVWPAGLSAWYEPIDVVSWFAPRTLTSMGVLAAAAIVVVVLVRRERSGCDAPRPMSRTFIYGFGWFLASIASTLPLIPSRNLLAADRYMYLPIIGLFWVLAVAGRQFAQSYRSRPGWPRIQRVLGGAMATCVVALMGVSWKTGSYYLDSVAKMARNLEIHPDSPNMHAKLGWAYLQQGDARRGLNLGREELRQHGDETADEAWQLIGLCRMQLGESAAAIDALRNAVAAAPSNKQARYRLASALADAGRDEEALAAFREIIPLLPNFNPGLFKAAGLYRRMGLPDDARLLYEQMLENNPYDIYAPIALAELDMTRGRYDDAATRLEALLAWYPEHATAATNLGVCYTQLGRTEDALAIYRRAVDINAQAVQAWINMALVLAAEDRTGEAERGFLQACRISGGQLDALVTTHKFYLSADRPDRAVEMWRTFAPKNGRDPRRVWLAWALTLNGEAVEAAGILHTVSPDEAPSLRLAAQALLAVAAQTPADLVASLEQLHGTTSIAAREAKAELLDAVMWYGQRHPDEPWAYLAAGRMLADEGRPAEARAGYAAFLQLCRDPQWREKAMAWQGELAE